jgi:predicted alpha/beta hydrolase
MDETRDLDTYLYDRESRPRLEHAPRAERSRKLGRDVVVPALDGRPLAGTLFESPGSRRVTLVAGATGVKRGYYARFAAFLASQGSTTLTFDYRGIGGSRDGHPAESSAAMHEWGELDIAGAAAWAESALDVPRVSVVTHSVGGQLLGLVDRPERIERVVMIGSQSGEVWLWPSLARWRMAALMYGMIPGVTRAVGYLPGALGIGEDLPPGVALEWARWCRTPGYLVADGGDERRRAYARLGADVLAFGFDDDPYAPPAAVDALVAFYPNANVTRRQVSRAEARVGHFGFFRERFASSLWREAAAFLQAKAG